MNELTTEEVCLALGYFDSVHLGHRNLIAAAKSYSESHGIACAVATFSNNAYKLFNASGAQVYTYKERCELLEGLCDYVLPMRFDTRFKNLTAEQFLNMLVSKYNIKAMVCGYDYLFGACAKGDAQLLQNYCKEREIDCIVVPKFELDGERVSTTAVKTMLEHGEIEKANAFLGNPYTLTGKVTRGRGAGRMFDIPTANVKVSPNKLLPKHGVYGGTCEVEGKIYDCAINIGGRPTFGLTRPVVEAMLKDFNDNIYDKEVKLRLYTMLRPITKFETPVELSKQVHVDLKWRSKC